MEPARFRRVLFVRIMDDAAARSGWMRNTLGTFYGREPDNTTSSTAQTAYWLMGWSDDKVIQSIIQRLHNLSVNRMRVTVAGRSELYYGDPVIPTPHWMKDGLKWTPSLTPWPAAQPEDAYHPGFDYSRFDLTHWQKFERALAFARDKDMIISLVLDMNDSRSHPAAGSDDELRFIRYAVARFGAYSNITWDLGDDLDQFRSDSWTRQTGKLIKEWDAYHHLATSQPCGLYTSGPNIRMVRFYVLSRMV